MTEMPVRSYLTSGSTTEAQFQSAIGDFYDVVNQLGLLGAPELNSLASNTITPSKCDIILETENLSSSGILNTISPTNIGEKMIFIKCKNTSRPITVKHLASGTGKIFLNTAEDTVLNDPRYIIALKWDVAALQWKEYWRNFGIFIASGSEATIRGQLGLGTAATHDTGILTGQIPLRENFGTSAFVNTGVGSGQVPLANQLGGLAFKSTITNSELDGSGVIPGTYSSVNVNAQGRVVSGSNVSATIPPIRRVYTATAVWNKPAGLKYVKAYAIGAGSGSVTNVQAVGPSSFGTFCEASGGSSEPGVGTQGDILHRGQATIHGYDSIIAFNAKKTAYFGIAPFLSEVPDGVRAKLNDTGTYTPPTGYGSAGYNGYAGGAAVATVDATNIPSTVPIIVGITGGGGSSQFFGTNGIVVIVEYY